MGNSNQLLEEITSKEYEHGWTVELETDAAPKGLNEGIVRFISKKKNVVFHAESSQSESVVQK